MREELLVRLVSAYGPRERSRIARRLGVSRETVVRACSRMGEEGLAPRPFIRMGKLGLQRFVVLAKGGTAGRSQLESTFSLMGDYAYLEFFQRLDPADSYLLMFAAPPRFLPELGSFLGELEAGGVLEGCQPRRMSWMRYHSIRGEWKGAEAGEGETSGPLTYVPAGGDPVASGPPDLDVLLMLAALQAKPSASLSGLVETISGWAGDYGLGGRVDGHAPNWSRTLKRAERFVDSYPMHLSRGDPNAVRRKRHGWASLTLWWTGLDPDEIRRSAMASTSVPYLRTDGASADAGLYFSVFAAPTRMIPGYLDFMGQNSADGMNVAFGSFFDNFSLPFLSFSPEEGRWAWKKEKLQSLVATLRTR